MSNTIKLDEPQLLVSVSDPALLGKLKNAIKMLNGVKSISVLKSKKQNWTWLVKMQLKEMLHNGTL